ncbi:hypothetical protein PoB_001829600 [Plakobranchus ocellatus]|uniref:Uncharacterized protein n=1 Tax=Plakobranchus ocellatus TaxID=259542 RepID=A0AAV3YXF6_9GAST|nr:hypothetical protein PoB_001829600 [Plakobranchus ocellatus]
MSTSLVREKIVLTFNGDITIHLLSNELIVSHLFRVHDTPVSIGTISTTSLSGKSRTVSNIFTLRCLVWPGRSVGSYLQPGQLNPCAGIGHHDQGQHVGPAECLSKEGGRRKKITVNEDMAQGLKQQIHKQTKLIRARTHIPKVGHEELSRPAREYVGN